MRIGLIDIDGSVHKKKGGAVYPNLALCKLARYHRQQGDVVEWALPYEHYDIIYRSKIFNFSEEDTAYYDADKVVYGGTGYDINSRLPDDIDRLQPDYSIYPNIPQDTAYGFLTRGCQNQCPWCVVPRKEGKIHPYMDVQQIAIEGRTNIVLMDNNILAAGDYAKMQMRKIIEHGYRIGFNQAMDARLMTEEFAELIAGIKWIHGRVRFGCDTPAQIKHCERAIGMIQRYGFKGEFFLYTMLNHDFDECYNRIHYWWERNRECRANHLPNIYPYAQPYRDPDNPHRKPPQWQKDMARWVNKRQVFQLSDFGDYEPRKGFKCSEYFH